MKKTGKLYLLASAILVLGTLSCKSQKEKLDTAQSKTALENMDKPNTYSVEKSEEEWLKELGPERYKILRQKGTERPFTGTLLNQSKDGTYTCAGCNAELFTSDMKFNSMCGWPSFDNEINGSIVKVRDTSHGMIRTEILCANCGGHLGHIFDDGPTSTGMRYCVNSLSIDFTEEPKK